MSARLRFVVTDIAGVKVVDRLRLEDDRGYLERLYCVEEMATAGWQAPVAQINHTFTRSLGTVRGMHFQHPPHAETKLVICLRGEVFDVALDLRAGSPTLLHWHGEVLSASNGRALLVPQGVAHGFQTLSDDVEMLYLHTSTYVPAAEDGVHPADPLPAIAWPLAIADMSVRDRAHPPLPVGYKGLPL